MGLIFKVMNVTPDMAQALLDASPGNRRIGPAKVYDYQWRMEHDEWVVAQPLMLDSEGYILNGHHRLTSVVASGRSVMFAVIEGYDRVTTYGVIDDGKNRQVADWLYSEVDGSYIIGPAITYLIVFDEGARWGSRRFNNQTKTDRQTKRAKLAYFAENRDELIDAFETFPRSLKKVVPNSLGFALYVLCWRLDPTDAQVFFEDLAEGANIRGTDPAYHLRERLMRDRSRKPRQLSETEVAAMVIKAWNWSRKGSKFSSSMLTLDKRRAYPMPT